MTGLPQMEERATKRSLHGAVVGAAVFAAATRNRVQLVTILLNGSEDDEKLHVETVFNDCKALDLPPLAAFKLHHL